MKIVGIDKGSIAEEIGLKAGDVLRAVNGRKLQDVLDFRFHIADEFVELEIEQDGEPVVIEIEKEPDETLGVDFEPIKVRMCGNDCPFCFVDQNPAGMRDGLYFRDEDFRLSFLAGHYVTLTNISKRDLERIVEQRLSPLYISVHAIRPEVRKFLLGLRQDDRLLEKLEFLTQNGIELHTQVVVCPTHNDGEIMVETFKGLAKFFPQLRSVALVPLGLTKHREGLTKLEPITPKYAGEMIDFADVHAAKFKESLGINFVYPSDEFYILAKRELPTEERYDAFDQLENGVGMVRGLLNDFHEVQPDLPKRLKKRKKVTLVSGTLMGDIVEREIVSALNRVENFEAELVIVKNDFYGETIRITGLLTGQDIYKNLSRRENGDMIFLPKNCVNDDGVFLDNWSLPQLERALNTSIHAINSDFSLIFTHLNSEALLAA